MSEVGRAIGHPQYLEEASKAIGMLKGDKIKILKADIFNEITLRHPIPGGILLNLKHFISLNPATGEVILGDIRPNTMELHAVECDQEKVDMAQYMQMYEFVKVIKGDIRHLPYEDKYFDLVLDFSTIDHIQPEEIDQAFAEYSRILKTGGLFILVSWCADEYRWGGIRDHKGFENQYYFLVKDLWEKFLNHFSIEEEEKGYTYPHEGTQIFMYRFLGRKK